jgi:hypothetical protein
MTRALLLGVVLWCGCAAIGGDPGGSQSLPSSGGGPFRPLPPSEDIPINAPFVLLDNLGDLDDPTAVTDGEAIALWVTTHRKVGGVVRTRIEHADCYKLEDGFGDLVNALEADRAWEGGEVSQPSVLWPKDGPWLLFYEAGGSIGWAVSQDAIGHAWVKGEGPALVANTQEEGNLLSAPAVVKIGDRVRVYYLAEAPFSEIAAGRATTWTRLDADPSTPARDPVLRSPSFAPLLGRATAHATITASGRLRHDLHFTAYTGTESVSTAGYAGGSDDSGLRYEIYPTAILPPAQTTRAPTMAPYRAGALLLYVQRLGTRDSIAAAISP